MTTHLRDGVGAQSEFAPAQREVQRWLGRCMLLIQLYERLMKAVVAHHDISGPASALQQVRQARIESTAKNTLGLLIGQLVGSFIVNGDAEQVDNEPLDSKVDVSSVSFRTKIGLSAVDFDRTHASLKELVQLRNGLVHHFVERFDLWSNEGCEAALAHLQEAYTSIDQYYTELCCWVDQMKETQALALSFMQTDAFTDLIVNGIAPDGNVHWPASGIVCSLREAAQALAIDGWTSLDAAVTWIGQHHPDQQPAKYGCRRWRQVLHESRCFEWCYRSVEGGTREAWFRPR